MSARAFLANDSLLTERVRLAIVATLAASAEPLSFNELLAGLDLTKGNLASHARRLEDAGLVDMSKTFVGRKTRTTYTCTAAGRQELRAYLDRLEAMIRGWSPADSATALGSARPDEPGRDDHVGELPGLADGVGGAVRRSWRRARLLWLSRDHGPHQRIAQRDACRGQDHACHLQ